MRTFLFFLSLIWTVNLIAQNTEGTIFYTETIKFEIDLGEGQEHLKDLIPNSNSQSKALFFTAEKSLYKDLDSEDDKTEYNNGSEDNEVQIQVISASADNRLFKDLTNKKVVDQRDFMGKKFLIKGTMEEAAWKMTGEQKKILDYVCQKAVLQDTSQNLIAWFTPQIPVANGPDKHGQLPGMILEVSIDDGERTITASQIVMEKLAEDIFEIPTKGKKVSIEEFKKIQEEKMKEMGGGTGRTVIQVEMRG